MKFLQRPMKVLPFNDILQDAVLSGQEPGMAVEALLLTIQSGTVTLVPAVVETDIDEVPLDESDYNPPTLVSRERVAEVPDLTMVDPSNSVTLRVPARQLRKWHTIPLNNWYMMPGCRPLLWNSIYLQLLSRHARCKPKAAFL